MSAFGHVICTLNDQMAELGVSIAFNTDHMTSNQSDECIWSHDMYTEPPDGQRCMFET